jgi:hypothetical protein
MRVYTKLLPVEFQFFINEGSVINNHIILNIKACPLRHVLVFSLTLDNITPAKQIILRVHQAHMHSPVSQTGFWQMQGK